MALVGTFCALGPDHGLREMAGLQHATDRGLLGTSLPCPSRRVLCSSLLVPAHDLEAIALLHRHVSYTLRTVYSVHEGNQAVLAD